MQSFLFIGANDNNIEKSIESFIEQKFLNRLDFEITTIDSVRELNRIAGFKRGGTAIVVKNINHAGVEAMNAFLKNLEEPQKNLFFLLSAKSIKDILPTIISRCRVINVVGKSRTVDEKELSEFDNMGKHEKLKFFSSFKDRDDTITYLENLLIYYHSKLISVKDVVKITDNIDAVQSALKKIKANGNIMLQLTDLVIELV